MLTFKTTRMPLRRKLGRYGDRIQLAVWREVIRLNRTAAKARQWLAPIKGYLWLPPTAFVIGLIGGFVSRFV